MKHAIEEDFPISDRPMTLDKVTANDRVRVSAR
jgi:hypothetical protein